MKSGKFSYTGHRFRFNAFKRIDYWFTKKNKVDRFFDYIPFSTDTFDVPKDKITIAEIYFRLNSQ